MIEILRSATGKPNQTLLCELRNREGEDNVSWLRRNGGNDGPRLVLLGGKSMEAFRVRVAQSHARDDMTPSHWSHVYLVLDGALTPKTELHHVQIEPTRGWSRLMGHNGVETAELAEFQSAAAWPNVAVIGLASPKPDQSKAAAPVVGPTLAQAVESFKKQRTTQDSIEHALAWAAFICGVGRSANPLLDGIGLPGSVMVESVLSAMGIELTPSLPTRSACPEGIWQGLRWWHEYHARERQILDGRFVIDHDLALSAGGVEKKRESGKPD